MVRKTFVLVTLVAFLLVSSLTSASQMSQSSPEFLKDTGAIALTSDEMVEVRGEFFPLVAAYAYIYGVSITQILTLGYYMYGYNAWPYSADKVWSVVTALLN
ncbi:hypothetical protein KKC45_04080 [Patescibacteria group bacterium]|nr:hypothetical protein [Patescibacteria group bacterium]